MVDTLVVDNLPDYYRLLHVHPEAPAAVIKASYRAMMQKMRLHPDLGGDEALAQRLNMAVATLCHAVKRAEYDAFLAASRPTPNPAAGGTPNHRSSQSQNTQQRTSRSHADNGSAYGADNSYHSTWAAGEYIELPTKPHCPFCHTVYARATESETPAANAYDKSSRCSLCQGSATPINQLASSSSDDLRRMYRHEHKTPILLWTQWPTDAPLSATMADLSTAGCALEHTTEIAVNTVVSLDSPLLNGIGEIRYSRPSRCGRFIISGLAFLTLQITAEPGAVFSVTA